jgi:hypothetical protein
MAIADISQITGLGAIDAETDFDPKSFVPSTSWERVRSRDKPLVIGRKGTGKTALRFALKDEADNSPLVFTTALAFRDYPWSVHYNVFDPEVGGRSRYHETWLFLMLVELCKLRVGVNQHGGSTRDQTDVLAALEAFLRDTWGGPTFDHRDIFKQKRFRVTKATLAPTVIGAALGSVDWTTVDQNTLGDALRGMNGWLRTALAEVIEPDAEYFIVFDELDLDFERDSSSYVDSMIGLVLATQTFALWARSSGLPVAAVVLLRDDIYGELNFPDKNKITTNLVERLQWNGELSGTNSLKTVIDRRIEVLLNRTGDTDPWSLLFDQDLMRGTQQKYAHMVQRTYLRPRDIIQFANECILEARKVGRIANGMRIQNDDVINARTTYSTYLRNELNDEIHAHYAGWENWLEILRRLGRLTFSRADFDTECGRSPRLTHGLEPTEVLEALYRFGIIAFGRRGGKGKGGTDEYWSYRDPDVTFDSEAPYFKVHQGLKESLDLKEGAG